MFLCLILFTTELVEKASKSLAWRRVYNLKISFQVWTTNETSFSDVPEELLAYPVEHDSFIQTIFICDPHWNQVQIVVCVHVLKPEREHSEEARKVKLRLAERAEDERPVRLVVSASHVPSEVLQ